MLDHVDNHLPPIQYVNTKVEKRRKLVGIITSVLDYRHHKADMKCN